MTSTGAKAIAAAVVVGCCDRRCAWHGHRHRQERRGYVPSAGGLRKHPSSMMLGLVFIETAIIYALIVAILIIFVL